jgi:hypothetical protein
LSAIVVGGQNIVEGPQRVRDFDHFVRQPKTA